MKPVDNNSLNKFILSFLSEDAADTIKAQGKATPKAGSVDAIEDDAINSAINKAIEAGSMFEDDDSEEDKEVVSEEDEEDKDKEAVSEDDDSDDDKEVVSEDEDEDDKKVVSEEDEEDKDKEAVSEAEEDDKEKEVVSEDDSEEGDKKVVAEDEDELEFSQADLDDLEAELDDEDSVQEGEDSFDPWPMRKGAVSEEDDSEEDKEVVSEDDEEDKDKEAVSEDDDSDEDDKKVVSEDEDEDEKAKEVSEEDEFSGEDELKKDEEDEDEIVLPKVDEDSEEEKLKFESSISAIFNGNEKLSEEQIKEKAKAIFEASVQHRVSKYVNKLNKIFRNAVMTESRNKTAKWSKALDRYLDHVVTEWKKENKVAIRRSVSDELTESISRDITQILKKRGVVIPENKVDVVKKSLSEAQALKKKLNEAEKANAALRESNNKAKGFLVKMLHRNAILKAVEGLKESEKAKILPVIKQITFKNEQDFLGKAKVIRESYVKKSSVKSETLVESKIKTTVNDKLDESVNDPIMAGYLDSLDRTIRK